MMRISKPLDALFPSVLQEILAAAFSNPERWWYASDLSRHLRRSPSSLQRELVALIAGGIFQSRKDGNRVYVRPDPDCPFLSELQSLLAKTAGIADVLQEALLPFTDRIHVAFVYGSVARGEEHAGSDIDLLIIGDVSLSTLAPALRIPEERLGRAVNATVFTPSEFACKKNTGHHFVGTVLRSQKLFLIGNDAQLDDITGPAPRAAARHKRTGTG